MNAITEVGRRVRALIFPTVFVARFVRNLLMGAMFATVMAETIIWNQLNSAVRVRELPWYMLDACIIGVGGLEMMMGPLVSWIGADHRRSVLMGWLTLPAIAVLILLPLPSPATLPGTAKCFGSPRIEDGFSLLAAIRLTVVLVVASGCAIARQAVYNHGIAYLDEHNSDSTSNNIGIIFGARVFAIPVFSRVLNLDSPYWTQSLGVVVPLCFNILQTLALPQRVPYTDVSQAIPVRGRGYMKSVARVLRNKIALTSALIMGLLAAAAWGYGWNENAILKAKFTYVVPKAGFESMPNAVLYKASIIASLLLAAYQSPPIRATFNRMASAALALRLTLLTFILYLVLTLAFKCRLGPIRGLSDRGYLQPGCSAHCVCSAPWSDYQPICVTSSYVQPITYLSPCHAGCVNSEPISGLAFWSNCACGERNATLEHVQSGPGRGIPQACHASSCRHLAALQQMIFVIIVALTVLVMQLHSVLIIRSVDVRDRSLALGITGSIITLFTFVLAHSGYFLISAYTCAWSERNTCLLQAANFPQAVAGSSAGLALCAGIAGIYLLLCIRRHPKTKPTEELSIGEL